MWMWLICISHNRIDWHIILNTYYVTFLYIIEVINMCKYIWDFLYWYNYVAIVRIMSLLNFPVVQDRIILVALILSVLNFWSSNLACQLQIAKKFQLCLFICIHQHRNVDWAAKWIQMQSECICVMSQWRFDDVTMNFHLWSEQWTWFWPSCGGQLWLWWEYLEYLM